MKKKTASKGKSIPESIVEDGTSFIIKLKVSSDSKNLTERVLHKCLALATNSNMGLGFLKSCLFKNSVISLEELGLELDSKTKEKFGLHKLNNQENMNRYASIHTSKSYSSTSEEMVDDSPSPYEDELESIFGDDDD